MIDVLAQLDVIDPGKAGELGGINGYILAVCFLACGALVTVFVKYISHRDQQSERQSENYITTLKEISQEHKASMGTVADAINANTSRIDQLSGAVLKAVHDSRKEH